MFENLILKIKFTKLNFVNLIFIYSGKLNIQNVLLYYWEHGQQQMSLLAEIWKTRKRFQKSFLSVLWHSSVSDFE